MKIPVLILSIALSWLSDCKAAAPSENVVQMSDSLKFYNALEFVVIGKFHHENNYNRFPETYQNKLRPEVWQLSLNAAGIAIRFRSNARSISIRWILKENLSLPHMAATGVKGLDLYATSNGQWQFVQTAKPKDKSTEYSLFELGEPIYREYLLNLPLYDGVDSLFIGVNQDADLTAPKDAYLLHKKPVVYYGSSIAQGACASRPGMAFTNILERKMDRVFINMGFSGNGTFDASVGEGMCETDAALYVIDCNPNTGSRFIYDSAVSLVKQLKQCKPGVPVLLVENFLFENNYFKPDARKEEIKKQQELKRAYNKLIQLGISNLYYLEGKSLIGDDHEGTVDGVHPTDGGMMRMSEALLPRIKKILAATATAQK